MNKPCTYGVAHHDLCPCRGDMLAELKHLKGSFELIVQNAHGHADKVACINRLDFIRGIAEGALSRKLMKEAG